MPVMVLIGTDGSDDAVAAARRGLELLAPGASVHVVCVAEPPAVASAGMESGFTGGIATGAEVDAAWAAVTAQASAALERTVAALDTATVETHVERGAPGAVLCELAAQLGADAIVVGSRGLGTIRRALLGSVSTYVVNNAPCAVVVVRSGTD
jgi:nucleotide-binding universal stress UspA family protein